MQESQASPLFFFLGLGRTTAPSSPWGTHLPGLARASRAVGSWSLSPFTGAEGWEDEALRGPWSGHTAGGLREGAVVCGPRGCWEFLFFCFVFQMSKDRFQFNIPGWRRETAEGDPPSGVCLSLSTERLISGSQRSKPAKPSTEPPSWSRSSRSASPVSLLPARGRRPCSDSKSKGRREWERGVETTGGWFSSRCPLWVGATAWLTA